MPFSRGHAAHCGAYPPWPCGPEVRAATRPRAGSRCSLASDGPGLRTVFRSHPVYYTTRSDSRLRRGAARGGHVPPNTPSPTYGRWNCHASQRERRKSHMPSHVRLPALSALPSPLADRTHADPDAPSSPASRIPLFGACWPARCSWSRNAALTLMPAAHASPCPMWVLGYCTPSPIAFHDVHTHLLSCQTPYLPPRPHPSATQHARTRMSGRHASGRSRSCCAVRSEAATSEASSGETGELRRDRRCRRSRGEERETPSSRRRAS